MKKISIITIVSGIILTIILVLGSSYALFYSESKFNNKETYTTGILDIELVDEEGYNTSISLTNSLPMSDDEGKQTTPFKLKLRNNGNLSYTFDLKLVNNTTENSIDTNYLKIMVDSDNPVSYSSLTDGTVKSDISLNPSEEVVIDVRLWLDTTTPNTQIGKTFDGKIVVEGEGEEYIDLSRTSSEMLEYLGLNSNSGTPNFGNDATTDEGIYAAEDDYGTSYYFRGAVENNYVKFADKYWRIIRINGDGTIRLIYDGTSAHANGESSTDRQIGTSVYNNTYGDNAYVGYMMGIDNQCTSGSCSGSTKTTSYNQAHSNTYSSTIKKAVDNWYKTNIVDAGYSDKVADVIYCNDRQIDTVSGYGNALGYGTNKTAYMAYNRVYTNKSPILTCTNQNDRFTVEDTSKGNGALTYPVGLITADEMSMGGAVYSRRNSSYYLYIGSSYWTMSPYGFVGSDAREFRVDSDGYIYFSGVNNTRGVRPVLSLKSDISVTGSGTQNDPFLVQ